MEVSVRQQVMEKLAPLSTSERPVYLVGGAVRDMLLQRPVHDLDFAVPGRTRALAKDIACQMNGALYVMDDERDITRVVLTLADHQRMMLDFSTLRAGSLEGDLFARDFTINAMAIDAARPDHLIDPTGGLADLREKRLRACSPTSLSNDPVRVLRLVRQALALQMRIDPQTLALARAAVPGLPRISPERVRDELFRLLDGADVHLGIRILDQIGALEYVLPELIPMKGVTQSAPHVEDVWEHTLKVVQALEQLYAPLVGSYNAEKVTDLTIGSAVLWLGRYREQLEEHFHQSLVPDRSLRALLFLAALYHDTGKPENRSVEPDGRIRFLEHEQLSKQMVAHRGRWLALSTAEIDRLEKITGQHMRLHFMANALRADGGDRPSRRTIFRFFRDTGPAGIELCLLSLADLRGTYGVTLPPDTWQAQLQACRGLFEAYWEKNEEIVAPPRFLSGDDLMRIFRLQPGRNIGHLLNAIRDAQAAGEVGSREEAEDFARNWIEMRYHSEEYPGEEGEK
jgi:tRNA nucleotidyltransferase/poly(A) polymerase